MIITNLTLTFTKDNEVVYESPVVNGSTMVTIGGNLQSMADSKRQNFMVEHFFSKTEWEELSEILFDFTKEIYYTPNRLLEGRSAIEPIKVIYRGSPTFEKILKDNSQVTEISYHVKLDFEEVLF